MLIEGKRKAPPKFQTQRRQHPLPHYEKEIHRLYHTITTTEATQRFKCPVHHGGKNLSVAVGFIDGRAWAKCWSHGCSQSDILAALGLTDNSPSIPWTPPPPRLRPTIGITPLPPVSHTQALDYLSGIRRPAGAAIAYQRDDGQRGKHWRNPDKRRNPGITGDAWQLRRFDPADPASAEAICLTEGEKDAAQLSAAGLTAFTAPRGAQSLPGADFTELVELAKDKGLPVLLCGDNDLVGREAMLKVRSLLKKDFHLDTTTLVGPEKGSVADFPAEDLLALIRLELLDRDADWQKPCRHRAMYQQFKCRHPKYNIKTAGDVSRIWSEVPCCNTATCTRCRDWENFLHIERCWRGNPAQMVVVSGFGGADSTIAETVGTAKVYREHLEGRLRKNSYVLQLVKNTTSERRNFMTALAIGDDYRASLTMFLSSPLSEQQIAKERRRAETAGLGFKVKDVVTREDIEDAAPPSLTINMEGMGMTKKTNTWTSSGWPTWWKPDTTYAFSDGRDLEEGEEFPADSISAKDWRREYGQQWDCTKTLKDNLLLREEYAYFNSQLWMAPCHGLNLETLQAIGAGGDIEALIMEVGDYQGPAALLRDTADWLAGRREWRKAFRPVLDAAGWKEQ